MTDYARIEMMQTVLIWLIFLGGYIYILLTITRGNVNKNVFPVVSIVLLVIYGLAAGMIYLVFRNMRNLELLMIFLLLMVAIITFIAVIFYMVKNHKYIHKGALLLFLLYVFTVLYITLFGRNGDNDTTIFVQPFRFITNTIESHSYEALQHFFLNVCMFVPVGFLFAMIDPEYLCKIKFVIPVGLMFSIIIETIQMMLKMGQCDIDDIIANTLGAMIGVVVYNTLRRFHLFSNE